MSERCVDVFNGDADGLCALQQLRLLRPEPGAMLVTGVKRDINLLARLHGSRGCRITVLDISLDRNRDDLLHLLNEGNSIFYVDHHYSGAIPDTPLLQAHIDQAPDLCTSLIVDRLLAGAHRSWALVGAYGDNLDAVADPLAEASGFSAEDRSRLRETGVLINYNGYGTVEGDLHVHPADLYREMQSYLDPLRFFLESQLLDQLRRGYAEDLAHADGLEPFQIFPRGLVYVLPEARWSRRIVGVLANRLAKRQPNLAHALLVSNPDGSLLVSVRAPQTTARGADGLCRRFATGGGRSSAAGINQLPARELERFLAAFSSHDFH